MKLILKREVAMERWRVVATLGFTQRRPEIVAILALADEHPSGVVTGFDVSQKLLAGRPTVVGERLLEVCGMMNLMKRTERLSEVWQLTELGRRALKSQEVPTPQRGEFDVWLLKDALCPEVIVRVRPTEPETPPNRGEKVEPVAPAVTQELPGLLRRCEGNFVRPPLRSQDEANEVFVFNFASLGRCVRRDRSQLSVVLHDGGGSAKFDVAFDGRQTSFAPVVKLPSLSDALKATGRSEVDGPLKIVFRTLSDSERRSARRETEIEGLALPDIGEFAHCRLTDVPLAPATRQDADEWAVWQLIDGIQGYVWPQGFEKHVRAVREFAVSQRWDFDPAIPTQVELARQRADLPVLVRRLLVPLDWQPTGALTAPVLILSGRAAQDKDARTFIKQGGDGIARVYVLDAADSKTDNDGVIAELGGRAIARRVRQPADVWLQIGPDGQCGQRWHPTSKPGSKSGKSKPPQSEISEGEWKDASEEDLARIKNELESAFWNRATQELQPDGAWVSVKSVIR